MIDTERASRTLAAVRQARALGIKLGEDVPPVEEIELMIERHKALSTGGDWMSRMQAAGRRRRRIAAAYLVGASQGQLALLLGITRQTVHDIATKELPRTLREQAALERVGKKAQLTMTQVSGILNAVAEDDESPVLALAARMQQALATVSEDEPGDEALIPTS